MTNRIKELRMKLGMTQEELARQAGVRRETIVFLEQGKYNPSLQLAHDVAQALETTIDRLFIFDGPAGRLG
jgi:putative transcriptional regulator